MIYTYFEVHQMFDEPALQNIPGYDTRTTQQVYTAACSLVCVQNKIYEKSSHIFFVLKKTFKYRSRPMQQTTASECGVSCCCYNMRLLLSCFPFWPLWNTSKLSWADLNDRQRQGCFRRANIATSAGGECVCVCVCPYDAFNDNNIFNNVVHKFHRLAHSNAYYVPERDTAA